MKLRRGIFAFVLMAIYVIASVGSSASILLCSHAHHHHHHDQTKSVEHSHHNDACSCEGLSFEAECCDHHHALLGENHTDYIASSQRSDSRVQERDIIVFAPLHIVVNESELCDVESVDFDNSPCLESWPLVAAVVSHESLRAPPQVA